MKTIFAALFLLAIATPALSMPPMGAQPSGYGAPYVYPQVTYVPTQQVMPQPVAAYRWGWFGADYYRPAPQLQRDYTGGWRAWKYRR